MKRYGPTKKALLPASLAPMVEADDGEYVLWYEHQQKLFCLKLAAQQQRESLQYLVDHWPDPLPQGVLKLPNGTTLTQTRFKERTDGD